MNGMELLGLCFFWGIGMYIIYEMSCKRKLWSVGVYFLTVIVVYFICIVTVAEQYVALILVLYNIIMPFLYMIIMIIINFKREKALYCGMDSQLRYKSDVIRTEYEDKGNVFCRCVVTEPLESKKKSKLILMVPSLPPDYGKKYFWFIDYNGNCYNSSGNYREFSSLYNYAPYNEISDALAEAGNLVIRLDMFGRNPRAVKEIDHAKDVTIWVQRIQELKGITDEPIVIGHRENGLFAVQLMQRNYWKRGILLCSGLNYSYLNYANDTKGVYERLQELTSDYSLIQIDAGLSDCRNNKKESTFKLQCAYKIQLLENMDDTLRYHDKRKKINMEQYDNKFVRKRRGMGDGIVGKGYRIKCGTGKFPPVCEELIDVLKAEIDIEGEFV